MQRKRRTCLVTGATSGIGRATALGLAAQGARVGILCRDRDKGERTAADIRTRSGNADLEVFVADLASQRQIRAVAAEILERLDRIDLLVNNAGSIHLSRTETEDGIETTFAVNHLAYFLLTHLLLDRLRASSPARIVNVASHAHRFVDGMKFDDLGYREGYASMRVYGHSKLANVLFTRELARRLDGSGVTVNAVHPGAVATGLGTNNGLWARVVMRLVGFFFRFRSPERGAATSLYAASEPMLEGVTGRYFANSREASPSTAATDDDAAARLWTISETLTGLTPATATAGN